MMIEGYHAVKFHSHRGIFFGVLHKRDDTSMEFCSLIKGTPYDVEEYPPKELQYFDKVYEPVDQVASRLLRLGKSIGYTTEAEQLLNDAITWWDNEGRK
jgi:hypothetical protein